MPREEPVLHDSREVSLRLRATSGRAALILFIFPGYTPARAKMLVHLAAPCISGVHLFEDVHFSRRRKFCHADENSRQQHLSLVPAILCRLTIRRFERGKGCMLLGEHVGAWTNFT